MTHHQPIAALTLALALHAHPALADEHWTTSWYAAPQPAWEGTFTDGAWKSGRLLET